MGEAGSGLPAASGERTEPAPPSLTLSFTFHSEQGDELLVKCHYQTLDRDLVTFVSASLPNVVNDNSLRAEPRPLALAIE